MSASMISRATRTTAWLATLALAAGVAVSAPAGVDAAPANGSSYMQAWGNNDFGQTKLPRDLQTGLKFVVKISLGRHHGVAATSDKKLYAWGNNVHGEGSVPEDLQNLGAIDVAAGNGFNVVLGDDFNARVWGDTPFGLDSVPEAAVAANLLEVAAGHDHALAKSSAGRVFAWGNNSKGQSTIPSNILNTTVQAIAAGNGFSMALSSAGKVFVWGDNTFGQRNIPSALDGKKVVQIAAGARHALALTSDNEIVAWGSNGEGALNVPALAPGDQWLQIAAGDGFSSGVAKDSPTAGVWGFGATGIRQPPAPSGSHPVSIVAGGDSLVQGFRRLGVSAAPSVTTSDGGVHRVGTPIQATHGVFGPTDVVTKTGQWLKVTGNVVTTVGTGMTYTPTAADIGSNLAFRTNAASDTYGTAFADTPQVPVKGTLFSAMAKPVIVGDAHVGATLKGALSSTPEADVYRYDWYADGVYRKTSDVRGEYVVQAADLGKKITLLGYADKAGFERIAAGSSDPTESVTRAPDFEVLTGPGLKGAARVGSVLTVVPPQVTPRPQQIRYQWFRNGAAVSGATASAYRPAPSDAGKKLTVTAVVKGAGRSDTTVRSRTVVVARTTPSLRWTVKPGRRSGAKRVVTIAVTVKAVGVPPLGGKVTVRDGKKTVKTISLSKGRRTFTVKLKRGKHTLTATYNGTTGVNKVSAKKKIRVR